MSSRLDKIWIEVNKMYLREINFDLPYQENEENIQKIMIELGCSYEDAYKKAYNENWKENIRNRFNLETRCIASMFARLLGKFKTKDCAKINIKCVDLKTKEIITGCLGIYNIEYVLDYKEFFLKDDYDKKRITLNIIKECMKEFSEEYEWDYTYFQAVFDKIEELEYENAWICGKPKKSPDKSHTAEIFLHHKVREIDIYMIIRNKKKEIIKKELIITELPDEFIYSSHLGKLLWVSENEAQLISCFDKIVGSVILS